MKIIIKKEPYTKLRCFVNLVNSEISGMAKSHLDDDNNVVIDDFVIFKQTCSAGSTDIDSDAIAKFTYELMKNEEPTEDWNIWWHSHDTMETFWSGTDNTTIEEHAGGAPYLISLVTNKNDEYKARLDIFPKDLSPFKKVCFATYDIDVEIEEDEKINKKIEEFADKIEVLEKERDKLIEAYDKKIQKLIKAQQQVKENTSTDVAIKEHCQKEIDEKVSNKTYIFPAYTHKYNKQGQFGFQRKKNKKWQWWNDYNDKIIEGFTDEDDLDYNNKYYSR